MKRQPVRDRHFTDLAAAVIGAANAAQARHAADCVVARPHEGDCQAAQRTYCTSADTEPGVSTYCTSARRFFAADVVGANSRRLMVRDDPDGVYVGGCLIADVHDLDDVIFVLTEFRSRREVH